MLSVLVPLLFMALPQVVGPLPPIPRAVVGVHVKGSFRFTAAPHPLPLEKVIFRFTEPGGEPKHWNLIDEDVEAVETTIDFTRALTGIPAGDWDIDMKLRDTLGEDGSYSNVVHVTVAIKRDRPARVTDFSVSLEDGDGNP